jgi:hypothetical protein
MADHDQEDRQAAACVDVEQPRFRLVVGDLSEQRPQARPGGTERN